MSSEFHALAKDALSLDPAQRLQLAAELIDSVEGPADAEWEAAWVAELDRRLAEADRTGNRGQAWEDVRARLLQRLAGR